MQKVIYFNKDCEIYAKKYAEDARAQEIANKIGNGIDKAAIVLCGFTCCVAIAIMVMLAIV
jgi:hypothetical protein